VTYLIFAFRYFLFLPVFDPQFLGYCNSAASSDVCSKFSSVFLSSFSQLSQLSDHSFMKSVKPFEVKHQAQSIEMRGQVNTSARHGQVDRSRTVDFQRIIMTTRRETPAGFASLPCEIFPFNFIDWPITMLQ
jgi:hypothetical protein